MEAEYNHSAARNIQIIIHITILHEIYRLFTIFLDYSPYNHSALVAVEEIEETVVTILQRGSEVEETVVAILILQGFLLRYSWSHNNGTFAGR